MKTMPSENLFLKWNKINIKFTFLEKFVIAYYNLYFFQISENSDVFGNLYVL